MSQDTIGSSPGWTLATIDDLTSGAQNSLGIGPFGSNLKVADYRDQGVPLVFVREIRREEFGGKGTKYISPMKAATLQSHTVSSGDLLVTKMGDPPGDTAIYPADRPVAVITSDCIKIEPHPEVTFSGYLKYCLRSEAVKGEILNQTKGVAQQKLSLRRFREIEVPIPPLNEQRRIVDRIEALQRRTSRARQALDAIPPLIEKFRQSVLASAFRGDLTADWREQNPDVEPASVLLERIREERRRRWEEAELEKMRAKGKVPSGEGWKKKYKEPIPLADGGLPDLPAGWTWISLDSLLDRIEAGKSPKAQGRPARSEEFGVLKVSAVSWGRFQPEENKALLPGHFPPEGTTIRTGDLLISRANTVDLVGAVVLVRQDYPNLMLSDKTLRLISDSSTVRSDYLLYALRSTEVRAILEADATGTSDSMRNLSQGKIRSAPIPLPPLEEQALIVQALEGAARSRKRIEAAVSQTLARINQLDQSILAKAFRGELVPQDPNDEPASVLLERIRAEKASQEPRRKRRRSSAPATPPSQLEIFAEPEEPAKTAREPSPEADVASAEDEGDVSQWVKEWLAENPGWHARADVMAAVEIDAGDWSRTVDELLASGEVERTGEKRGTRYRWRGDDRSLVAWWFAEHPGWHSRQEVLEDLEIDAGTWNQAIRELVSEGEVVRTGEKRGTRYRWWEDEPGTS